MKSILLITEGFPFGTSEQSFIQSEFDALSENFNVSILTRNIQNSDCFQKGYEGVKVFRYTMDIPGRNRYIFQSLFNMETIKEIRNVICGEIKNRNKLKVIKSVIWYMNIAIALKSKIKKIIEENDIGLVYTYWCMPVTLSCIILKKEINGLKVVSRFHGIDLYNERTKAGWQPFRKLMAAELDRCFFACEYAQKYFMETWGTSGEIHYLGTKQYDEISEESRRFVLISCSFLIPLKRVDLIIRALSELPDEYVIEWHHFGDGEERDKVENLAMQLLDSKNNIHYCFHGYLENNELIKTYRIIKPSLFISTSASEGGCPVSIQEALCLGIPCIGTKVGGIPDAIIDGENGFLLNKEPSPTEIVEKIIHYYLTSYEEKKTFSKTSRSIWENKFNAKINSERFVQSLSNVYLQT